MAPRPVLVAPSVLACKFGRLADEVRAVEDAGADWIHLDVMDGQFVPNISFGPVIVNAVHQTARKPIDVQLMIEHPERYAGAFLDAGADVLTVHVESRGLADAKTLRELLAEIRRRGAKAGLSVRPGTPADALRPYAELVDLILIMTVEPGFGGQAFLPDMLAKIRQVREWYDGDLEVDGGINDRTARQACEAGANVLVAGTYVFGHQDYGAAIRSLRPPR